MTSAPSIELKRHYAKLSPDETTKVVDAVAELIVAFLKNQRGPIARVRQSVNPGPGRDGVSAMGAARMGLPEPAPDPDAST